MVMDIWYLSAKYSRYLHKHTHGASFQYSEIRGCKTTQVPLMSGKEIGLGRTISLWK